MPNANSRIDEVQQHIQHGIQCQVISATIVSQASLLSSSV